MDRVLFLHQVLGPHKIVGTSKEFFLDYLCLKVCYELF